MMRKRGGRIGMSEEGGCTIFGESISGPNLPEMLINNTDTSRSKAVQGWRPENWKQLKDDLQMAHSIGGCEEKGDFFSISTLFRYRNICREKYHLKNAFQSTGLVLASINREPWYFKTLLLTATAELTVQHKAS